MAKNIKALPGEITEPKCKLCNSIYRRQIESWLFVEALSKRNIAEKIKTEFPEAYYASLPAVLNHFKKHTNDASVAFARLWFEKNKAEHSDLLAVMNKDPIDIAVSNLLELERTINQCSTLRDGAVLEILEQMKTKIPKYYPIKDEITGEVIRYERVDKAEPNGAMVSLLKNVSDTLFKAVETHYAILGQSDRAKDDTDALQTMKLVQDLLKLANKATEQEKKIDEDEAIDVDSVEVIDFQDGDDD